MLENGVHFAWRGPRSIQGFHSGVCLHGHTMHSRECLSFLPRYLRLVPGISPIVSYYEREPRGVDFARAWWTPPLSPASALSLEREQIASLGLEPMVSLTDHDDIEAGMALSVTTHPSDTPISVEWTVPYQRACFHIGVHNIPGTAASCWMDVMTEYTASPCHDKLAAILREFSGVPDVLIVLNHPFWLEEGETTEDHREGLDHLLRECIGWIDAFELNGTRQWSENAEVIELARAHQRPLISGGDRHGCEPSACINLTNAHNFAEFVSEVHAGRSNILFLPHYRESVVQRLLETSRDILRAYPEYPGREHWPDRIYYRGHDGVARTVAEIWKGREPRLLAAAVTAVQFLARTQFRPALRMFFSERGELQP